MSADTTQTPGPRGMPRGRNGARERERERERESRWGAEMDVCISPAKWHVDERPGMVCL